jgi:hypothetical protein
VNVLLVFDATEAAVDDTEVNDIPCGRNEVAGPASASDAACAAAICISKSRDDAFWGRRREEFDGLLSASGATGTPAVICMKGFVEVSFEPRLRACGWSACPRSELLLLSGSSFVTDA